MRIFDPNCLYLRALLLLSLSAGLLQGGCAGGPKLTVTDLPPFDPLAAPPYGMAQVCILRPHTWALLHTIPIEDNGQVVGATRGPSFFCYLAHPGEHRIRMPEEKSAPIDIRLAAGERAYLHLRVRISQSSLRLITNEAELPRMLDKCEYTTLVDWPGHDIATEAYVNPRPTPPEPDKHSSAKPRGYTLKTLLSILALLVTRLGSRGCGKSGVSSAIV